MIIMYEETGRARDGGFVNAYVEQRLKGVGVCSVARGPVGSCIAIDSEQRRLAGVPV